MTVETQVRSQGVFLDRVTATGIGPVQGERSPLTLHFWMTGTSGGVSATIQVYGSNDPEAALNPASAGKILLGTTTDLSGTGAGEGVACANDFFVCLVPYTYYWCYVTAINGTGAKVFARSAMQ